MSFPTVIFVLSIMPFTVKYALVVNCYVYLFYRCVDPEDKSIALGAASGIFSLLGNNF